MSASMNPSPPDWDDTLGDPQVVQRAHHHLAIARAADPSWSSAARARVQARLAAGPRGRWVGWALPAVFLFGLSAFGALALRDEASPGSPPTPLDPPAPSSPSSPTAGPRPAGPTVLRTALRHLEAARFEEALNLAEQEADGPYAEEWALIRVKALIGLERWALAHHFLTTWAFEGSPRGLELLTLRAELAARLDDCASATRDAARVIAESTDPGLVERAGQICPGGAR